ncbi:gamma-glutamyl-gamma-aminobutyrate hydrolase family protein [Atopomonas sediminilitoris]|uniref:gamma-glutamyl-gamma-aminobutyrate hydrolase family protein n=1 Tax=Atopomonas sediminilitoris TaxID=2919919 RepID=UPI001F4DDDFD|nr:gamma-glutamyl-gamma-aminobutyrate hydrolase family protein [Atopomonas sediminilitoris]MCJ8169408.1 gamma-glutamyl-gamma-aminobutyrate hydrolase family protein [Atopomonas sediminilitoris]
MSATRLPVIGVTACTSQIGKHPFHIAGDKYVRAVSLGAGGLPLVIPALSDLLPTAQLLAQLDGLLFTGSPSNVEPHHYKGSPSAEGTQHDPARDATTLPLIRAAIAAGVPVLGICRGFQEMNVAYGGTLHQKVHEVPELMDHREPQDQPLDVQYGPAHDVHVDPGGVMAGLGLPETFRVNSIHGQGVDQLAPGLRTEARAPDGLIEAFSIANARTFALGVQWHPEWKVTENPNYLAIFQAFGKACQERASQR